MSQVIFGINAVNARLAQPDELVCLYLREGRLSPRLQGLFDRANARGCPVERKGNRELDQQAGGGRHQGAVLLARSTSTLATSLEEVLAEEPGGQGLLLLLDGVTDPGNLGACLRSAATLGVKAVIAPRNQSAPLNGDAIKRASGAAQAVPYLQVTNLARAISEIQAAGYWVIGTTLDASEPIDTIDCTGNIALVMGAEGSGIRHKTAEACDFLAHIPMANGSFGFNVSVATGICLYEIARQRNK